jgi:predicted PurR-regulated permease PerM
MRHRLEAERFSWIIFYATVLLIGYLAWQIVKPFLPEIGWAIVLAICLEPVRARVAPRFGRTRTAMLLSLLVLAVIVVPVVFIGATLVNEGGGAVDYVGQQLRSQGGPGARFHAAWGWLRIRASFLPSEQDVIARITASLGGFAQFLAGQATGLLASAAGLLFALVITMAVLFFLLRDASDFARAVRRILPFGAEQNERLIGMAYDLVSASVSATLACAVVLGAIGGVTFALLGIPGAVLWGVMMGLLSFLPLVGTAFVWAPAAIWLALSGSLTKGIILAAVGLGIMGQVDNVVRPLLLSGKSQLSTVVLIISLMGGVSAFGFIGIVLGPLVAALVTALFESYEESLPSGDSFPGGAVAAPGSEAATQAAGPAGGAGVTALESASEATPPAGSRS